jgi:hypothetical protein
VQCLFTKPVEFDSLSGMSDSILTPPEDRAHFLRKMRHLTPSPVHRWMNALLLLDDGWAAERVADVLFIDAERCANIDGGIRLVVWPVSSS